MVQTVGERYRPPWQPRITSLGHAVADRVVMTMDECMSYFGYTSGIIKAMAQASKISGKHWWCDPRKRYSVQEMTEDYEAGALALSCEAIQKCLDAYPIEKIGTFIYASCTKQLDLTPGMAFKIAGALGMRSNVRMDEPTGLGCQGALPSLETGYAHLMTFGEPVLLVACEICSATFFDAPQGDVGNSLATLLFSDGASAALLDFSDNPAFPAIIGFDRYFSKDGERLLGYDIKDGRKKVRLSKDVRTQVPPMVAQTIQSLLKRHSLTTEDISNWCLHNGGAAILDEIALELGLDSQQAFRYSWETLSEYGNLSSATVGLVAEKMHGDPTNRHGWCVAAAMGAGAGVGAALLRYD